MMNKIKLFHIPVHKIDTRNFSNLLSDQIIREFEEIFCEYVGGKYAISVNSATSAIFLVLKVLKGLGYDVNTIKIPSICPPVVANAINQANCNIAFEDNVNWVGGKYILWKYDLDSLKVFDSAHEVNKDSFKNYSGNYISIYSHFPTKPVGSTNLGTIVTNQENIYQLIKHFSNNGMVGDGPSWTKEYTYFGFKMHPDSLAGYIAIHNLRKLDQKKEKLDKIRFLYNNFFGLNNTSDHLYRVNVKDNLAFIKKMQELNLECGLHYTAIHLKGPAKQEISLPLSERESYTTVSLPFHEKLTKNDIEYVCQNFEKYKNIST